MPLQVEVDLYRMRAAHAVTVGRSVEHTFVVGHLLGVEEVAVLDARA